MYDYIVTTQPVKIGITASIGNGRLVLHTSEWSFDKLKSFFYPWIRSKRTGVNFDNIFYLSEVLFCFFKVFRQNIIIKVKYSLSGRHCILKMFKFTGIKGNVVNINRIMRTH